MAAGTKHYAHCALFTITLLAFAFGIVRVHGRRYNGDSVVWYKDSLQEESTVSSMTNAKSRFVRALGGVPVPAVINGSHLEALNWMVSLQYPDGRKKMQHFCGGSILSNRIILTAAHCLYHSQTYGAELLNEKLIRVRFGGRNMSDGSDFAQVDYLLRHPHYNHSSKDRHKYLQDDIAIIRLSRAIRLDTSRQGSVMLGSANNTSVPWYVAGWGFTEPNPIRTSTLPQLLMQAEVHYATPEFCQRAHPEFMVTDRMICTHSTGRVSGICQGDSGGPLFTRLVNPQNNKLEYRLIGVSSGSSEGCAAENSASIFTKVGPYINNFVRPAINQCNKKKC